MVEDSGGDRTKKETAEATMSAMAHYDELSVFSGLSQHSDRMLIMDGFLDTNIRVVLPPFAQHFRELLLGAIRDFVPIETCRRTWVKVGGRQCLHREEVSFALSGCGECERQCGLIVR